jgi:hypothetical protein
LSGPRHAFIFLCPPGLLLASSPGIAGILVVEFAVTLFLEHLLLEAPVGGRHALLIVFLTLYVFVRVCVCARARVGERDRVTER